MQRKIPSCRGNINHCMNEIFSIHCYRVKACGMNFEWNMFQFTKRDCQLLSKVSFFYLLF